MFQAGAGMVYARLRGGETSSLRESYRGVLPSPGIDEAIGIA
jgi:hypothetical protein